MSAAKQRKGSRDSAGLANLGEYLVEYLLASAAFAVAGVVLLYPVFAGLGDSVFAPASPLSGPIARWVMWILAWDTHALFSSPGSLFDANIFYPVPDSLAFADPLIGSLPIFGPIYAITGQPVLAYQVTLLVTLALCGASMYALSRHWGCAPLASAIAGVVYAYCPARLGVLGEFPYVAGQFFPLAILFADRVAARPTGRDLLALSVFAAWQMFCGTQLAYAFVISIAAYVGGLVVTGRRSWSPMGLVAVAAGIVVAVGAFAWLNAPYRSLHAQGLYFGRSMYDFASFGSAHSWRSYLVPPYLATLGWPLGGGGLYVGLSVLALALLGVVGAVGSARRTGVGARLLVLAVACYWMSLGPDVLGGVLSPYGVALSRIPGFAMLGPAPTRFALFMMVAVAGLVAFGVEYCQRRLGGAHRGHSLRARRWLVAAVCVAAVLIDYRLPFQRFETQRVPYGADALPLYAALAELPPGPLLELPVDPCAVTEGSSAIDRQLASTMHWLPLLDGYRSHDRAPTTYEVVRGLANALPDPRALELLRRTTGLRYVVVHLADLAGDWRHRWRSVEGMTRVGFFGHDLLFEVTPTGEADLRRGLLELPVAAGSEPPGAATTLAGTRLAELVAEEGDALLTYTKLPPPIAMAGGLVRAELLIENRSDQPWPSLTLDRERKIFVSYLWTDPAGQLVGGDGQAQPLPFDLDPGQSVIVPVCVEVPRGAGELSLAFGLSQSEEWFPDLSERLAVTVIR